MKTILLIVLSIILFSGCTDPTKTKNIHTVITIQKDDMIVLNYDGLVDEFRDKVMSHRSELYDKNATYILYRVSLDTYINITKRLMLTCGAESSIYYYGSWGSLNQNKCLQFGALAKFTKKELNDHNCLQADGQLTDLTGSLYGYAEYAQSKITPVKHTVTSNSITYTAQEINEAFAVFGE